MQLKYELSIPTPHTHFVHLKIKGKRDLKQDIIKFYLPTWSPGSYLIREYSRHIRNFRALDKKGCFLYFTQSDKCTWEINFSHPELTSNELEFEVSYEVFAHELTVRTSHVDDSHAFLHGPSLFMGVKEVVINRPTLQVEIHPAWSKITTGLKNISPSRELFIYEAEDYDQLIDTPIEIGCHETDGFQVEGIDHELAFFGDHKWHGRNLKKDIEILVKTVLKTTREIPYDKYTFITHFIPATFGGLEHLNSTVLQFCPMQLKDDKTYRDWLSLVAHEYFHTWNVKRIRPQALGPFDYTKEVDTSMLWLAEGLTSFMDELFVLRSGLCTLEDYLEWMKKHLTRFFDNPGRLFDSLESAGKNAWIKLYRPNENSNNSTTNYYLKGGLAFFVLNALMTERGHNIDALFDLLWQRFKERPEVGVDKNEVYAMIQSLAGVEVVNDFKNMIETTQDISFDRAFQALGLELVWSNKEEIDLGIKTKVDGERIFVESVVQDGPAYKGGVNAGDEVLAIDDLRMTQELFKEHEKYLNRDQSIELLLARSGRLVTTVMTPGIKGRVLQEIKINNKVQALNGLGVTS